MPVGTSMHHRRQFRKGRRAGRVGETALQVFFDVNGRKAGQRQILALSTCFELLLDGLEWVGCFVFQDEVRPGLADIFQQAARANYGW